ncbi:exo-alpha-sialidase [Rhodohalobacter sp. SW132]|uniref:WD40/YVTN/BNR-like repeat-containing protein n=1 Tax=Rhodohalobacter sp. SW132 TaxID=2293433 RepID=UPI0011C06A1A|nr:exo-alpha-sialidase [Rhodohalobacter sp. SW132]
MINRFILLALLSFTSILISCGTDATEPKQPSFEWNKLGLDGLTVNKIEIDGNLLYAATNDGLYRKNIQSTSSFEPVGLQDNNIEAFLIYSDQILFASVANRDTEHEYEIHKSDNRGASWQELESNFGGNEDGEILSEFLRHPSHKDTIYATSNYTIAKSGDMGNSWDLIWGEWGAIAGPTSAIAINPQRENELWAGGQGPIEDGYLVRLVDEEETDRWTDLVPNPTTVKEIVFDKQSSQTIFAGYEGALMKTNDNGASWQTSIDKHHNFRFFFGIAFSNLNPDILFAGGWLKAVDDPQSLKLFYSMDKGETWEEEIFENEPYGGILDMQLITEGDKDRIFIALDGGGIYEVIHTLN